MREITGEITLQTAKLDKTRKRLFTFGSHQVKHGGLGGRVILKRSLNMEPSSTYFLNVKYNFLKKQNGKN